MTRRTGMILLSAMACISLAGPARADEEDVYKGVDDQGCSASGRRAASGLEISIAAAAKRASSGQRLVAIPLGAAGRLHKRRPLELRPEVLGYRGRLGRSRHNALSKVAHDPKLHEPRYSWIEGENAFFEQLDRAARCDSCDWENPVYDYIVFNDIYNPQVQQCRSLMRLLIVRTRLQIADGKYDAAVRNIQTGFALARHVSQGHALMHSFVGVRLRFEDGRSSEEFVQQPGAPSLYWALATFPRPAIDFRPGWEAEMDGVYFSFPELRNLDKASHSPERWNQLLQQTVDKVIRQQAEERGYGRNISEKANGATTPWKQNAAGS